MIKNCVCLPENVGCIPLAVIIMKYGMHPKFSGKSYAANYHFQYLTTLPKSHRDFRSGLDRCYVQCHELFDDHHNVWPTSSRPRNWRKGKSKLLTLLWGLATWIHSNGKSCKISVGTSLFSLYTWPELRIRCVKWTSIYSTCVISSSNPVLTTGVIIARALDKMRKMNFNQLYLCYCFTKSCLTTCYNRLDDTIQNKWSIIRFDKEMVWVEITLCTLSLALYNESSR